jgi:hypothetical protein
MGFVHDGEKRNGEVFNDNNEITNTPDKHKIHPLENKKPEPGRIIIRPDSSFRPSAL